MNKKILLACCLIVLLSSAGFAQTPVKAVAIEWNVGYLALLGLEFEVDANLGALAPKLNGLNLHASLLIPNSLNIYSIASGHAVKYPFIGLGFTLGARYCFGPDGISGFFAGLDWMYVGTDIEHYPITEGYSYINLDLGGRFLLTDVLSLTLGLCGGVALYPSKWGGLFNYYGELILGIGVAL